MYMLLLKTYYIFKPFIPRSLQITLRRFTALRKRKIYQDIWPINKNAGKKPDNWPGWPNRKKFALVLTHDVDTERGHEKCYQLMELESESGFHSSFNFVPERYEVSSELRAELENNGFEVGVHGLKHDGKLYSSLEIFKYRAKKINRYLKDWNAVGFRSPAMHSNLNWIKGLNIKYDASTFDTDPFEPQSEGVQTIFPFWVNGTDRQGSYLELPYTLAQDHLLFIILRETNLNIWKQKLEWIAKNGGMALLNTHPDYMSFGNNKCGPEEYPVAYYAEFLAYIKSEYGDTFWHVLPKEMAKFMEERKRFCV